MATDFQVTYYEGLATRAEADARDRAERRFEERRFEERRDAGLA